MLPINEEAAGPADGQKCGEKEARDEKFKRERRASRKSKVFY